MKNLNKYILVWCLMIYKLNAQTLPHLSNFHQHKQLFNPAAVGTGETVMAFGLLNKIQWSGIDGAPNYYMFWGDYKFKNQKSNIGLNLAKHQWGANNIAELTATYAHMIQINGRWKLNFGLRFGADFFNRNELPENRIFQVSDPFQYLDVNFKTNPVAGGGLYCYRNNAYIGFSIPDIIGIDNNSILNENTVKNRAYILHGGYKFHLSEVYRIRLNSIFQYNERENFKVDVNSIFEIRDYFWLGLSASSKNYHSLMVGTHISSSLQVSYAFQFGLGQTVLNNLYTHEIGLLLNLDMLKK